MGQKRVSLKVAKAIKEVGYPQDYEEICYFDDNMEIICKCPRCIDVWLWLWVEKNIKLSIEPNEDEAECFTTDLGKLISKFGNEPEEAIAEAIEYLVDNDLIK